MPNPVCYICGAQGATGEVPLCPDHQPEEETPSLVHLMDPADLQRLKDDAHRAHVRLMEALKQNPPPVPPHLEGPHIYEAMQKLLDGLAVNTAATAWPDRHYEDIEQYIVPATAERVYEIREDLIEDGEAG